ncbi:orotate phosphoribosyltransferase [SAR92 clade bacterium H921]|jgi:orotate phosphoribosyltransferase|nr:orotate phosphoribosyltransferase [SAR92 clade bacterium H921]MDG0971990.1 orotate phosphoribosyltransferase [Porticoccaceae bacterium]MDG1306592.1 orotate phosphoribosyltransferase [Porticoccaceae bacterium]
MKNTYKTQFIDNALASGALKFGQFRLKSGRISPHFFNAGEFYKGKALAILGRCYAAAIIESGIEFDVLFGPAYKGITLAAATSVALAEHYNMDVPYCFNRKEAKSHGEGGTLVGAPLTGKVLIIDDVITAGTAIREVMTMVEGADAEAAAVMIGLDRKERGASAKSAIQEVEEQFSIPVISIIDMDDILSYLQSQPDMAKVIEEISTYRNEYGV